MFISGYTVHQMLAMAPVTFGNFMAGTIFGWLAPTLQIHRRSKGEFSLTDEDCSWMVSLQYVGRIAGCIFTGIFVDKFGRNIIISLAAILMSVSWISIVLTKVVILHLFFRSLFGFCFGITNLTTPIYVGENSSPHRRGVFGSISLLFYFGGQVLGCFLATCYSYEISTEILAGLSLVNLISVLLLQETTQYLLTKGQETKAESQFFWLRGNNENSRKEFYEMKTKLMSDKTKFSIAYILDRRVQIVCIVNSLVFLTGFPPLSSLVSTSLSQTDNFSSNELTIILELAQFIGAAISPLIIDRYKRRKLWMISCTLTIIFHLATASLYYSRDVGLDVPNYSWLLFSSITAYMVVFSTITYSLSSTTRGEFLPQQYKAAGSCTSLIFNSTIGSLLGHIYLKIAAAFGIKMNFIIFATSSFVLLMFCHFCVPETRGMSLIEIEKYFEKSKKAKENILES